VTVLLLLAGGGFGAGVFGSLLGLGGGILIVPLLTFGFGLDFRAAVGVSLVCVIVTSSAAAGVYLERHLANLRLGMLLEVFTASGALIGGLIAFLLPDRVLAGLFALLLVCTAVTMLRRRATSAGGASPSIENPDDAAGAAGTCGGMTVCGAGAAVFAARLAINSSSLVASRDIFAFSSATSFLVGTPRWPKASITWRSVSASACSA